MLPEWQHPTLVPLEGNPSDMLQPTFLIPPQPQTITTTSKNQAEGPVMKMKMTQKILLTWKPHFVHAMAGPIMDD